MNFNISEENGMLRDSINRFVQDSYPFELREQHNSNECGYSEEIWQQFAQLGWLGAAIPEEYGGINLGSEATMVVMEAFGRGLVSEPYLSTVVFGAELIARFGSEQQKADFLPAIATGSKKVVLAYAEPNSRYSPNIVSTTATKEGAFYKLSGAKGMVLNAISADTVVVSARTSGSGLDESGITLFLLDKNTEGLSFRDYQTYDGLRASEMNLDAISISEDCIIGEENNGYVILDEILDRATAALCAEAVGTMSMLFDMTLDYLKTRKQFGQTIGSFQTLQHRMVDLYGALENSRSMMVAATESLVADRETRHQEVSAAKIQINDACHLIGAQGVQMHGAVAITNELAAGHYYKRLAAIAALFGNSDYHLGRFIKKY